MPIPIVLDTDIGTDIDDAYALVLAAASPELDLKAVTTVCGDTLLRARIARRLLDLMGRKDVPVAPGAETPLTPGVSRGWMGHEGQGIDLSEVGDAALRAVPAVPELVGSLAAATQSRGEPLWLVSIGALTNIAWCLEKMPPASRGRIGGIVSMASCFAGFGPEAAQGEHNVACDPLALARVLQSGIPVALVGLNATRQTRMDAEDVARLERLGTPLAAALAGMHRVWFQAIGRDASPMHDALAVAALFRPDLLEWTAACAAVADSTEGVVIYNPPGAGQVSTCRIAAAVRADAFHALFFDRIERAARG